MSPSLPSLSASGPPPRRRAGPAVVCAALLAVAVRPGAGPAPAAAREAAGPGAAREAIIRGAARDGGPVGPIRQAAPPCVDSGDASGESRGSLSGDLDASLSGEAFFRSSVGADGRPGLEIRLDDPDLGRWQVTFTLMGLGELPRPGDLPVVGPDSAAALAASDPAGPGAVRAAAGELYLFDPTTLSGRTLVPAAGSIGLDAVDPRGVCGRFDVTWRSADAGGGLRGVRTRGTFRAANAGFGDDTAAAVRPRPSRGGAGKPRAGGDPKPRSGRARTF